MSLALDDVGRGSDALLSRLRELTDVVAQQNATIAALQSERDTVRSEHEAAQAEVEKLPLPIRQLQGGRFGLATESQGPGGCGPRGSTTGPGAARPRRRRSTSTPRTARGNIRPPTWPGSGACCRWTAIAASRACSRITHPGRSGSRSAG